jgi:hypothetical protein
VRCRSWAGVVPTTATATLLSTRLFCSAGLVAMGLVLLLAARLSAIWCKVQCGEVDSCGMDGCLGSIVRMQYLGPFITILADEFLVGEFTCDLTPGPGIAMSGQHRQQLLEQHSRCPSA